MVPPVVVPREISMIEKHYNRYLTESDAHLVSGSLLPGNGLCTTKRDAQRRGTYRASTTFAIVCPLQQRHIKGESFS
jgi:hypothetical protein